MKKPTAKARAVAERQAMDASGVRARARYLPPPPHGDVHYHARDPATDKIAALCGANVPTTGPTYSAAAVTCAKCRELLAEQRAKDRLREMQKTEADQQRAERAREDERNINHLATRIASEAAIRTIGAGRALTDDQLDKAEDAARRVYLRWRSK